MWFLYMWSNKKILSCKILFRDLCYFNYAKMTLSTCLIIARHLDLHMIQTCVLAINIHLCYSRAKLEKAGYATKAIIRTISGTRAEGWFW